MAVFSSFSFKIVDCFSAVTEFRELFSVKSVALLCCWDYRTVNSGKILLTHTAGALCSKKHRSGDAAFNVEFILSPRMETSILHFGLTPTSEGATSRRWTSNALNSVPEREHFLLPPLFTL